MGETFCFFCVCKSGNCILLRTLQGQQKLKDCLHYLSLLRAHGAPYNENTLFNFTKDYCITLI